MPEIGATLRETRIRAGLEISDIEASTKIRAKYLRAIENEEWDLLPGATFAKTFLRTYAEALDLDARLLIEEYKARYERYDEHELRPLPRSSSGVRAPSGRVRGGGGRVGRGRGRGGGGARTWIVVLGLVVVIAGVLFALGVGRDDSKTTASTASVQQVTSSSSAGTTVTKTVKTTKTKTTGTTTVRLQVVPSSDVYTCLVADGKRVVNGQTLSPGGTPKTYRAKQFEIALGNGSVRLRVDGKTDDVPNSATPVGYEITAAGRTRLTAADLPQCG